MAREVTRGGEFFSAYGAAELEIHFLTSSAVVALGLVPGSIFSSCCFMSGPCPRLDLHAKGLGDTNNMAEVDFE